MPKSEPNITTEQNLHFSRLLRNINNFIHVYFKMIWLLVELFKSEKFSDDKIKQIETIKENSQFYSEKKILS
jgi:hypothetical protein